MSDSAYSLFCQRERAEHSSTIRGTVGASHGLPPPPILRGSISRASKRVNKIKGKDHTSTSLHLYFREKKYEPVCLLCLCPCKGLTELQGYLGYKKIQHTKTHRTQSLRFLNSSKLHQADLKSVGTTGPSGFELNRENSDRTIFLCQDVLVLVSLTPRGVLCPGSCIVQWFLSFSFFKPQPPRSLFCLEGGH